MAKSQRDLIAEKRAWKIWDKVRGKPEPPDFDEINKFQALVRNLFEQTNPGNWGGINELLSARVRGESESAAKIKGQILQGEMARALSARIAQTRGSAALAAARTQAVAPKAAEAVGGAALQRRNEQGEAINTFSHAAQRQEALRADFLKMGLSDVQSKLAAKSAMERELMLRNMAKGQLTAAKNTATMSQVGALAQMLGVGSVMYGSMGENKAQGVSGNSGGYTDYMTKQAEKDIIEYPETQIEDNDNQDYGYDWRWA